MPKLSVLIPWADARGDAAGRLQVWMSGQTLPGGDYEVIVGYNGTHPEEALLIQSCLRVQDRMVPCGSDSNMDMWRVAAEAAGAEWLFATELHCTPKPDTLERVVRETEHGRFDVFFTDAVEVNPTDEAWLLDRNFQEYAPVFKSPEHWNKVHLRGTAFHREWFQRGGGLSGEFGLFTEALLSMRLHRAGARLGFVPEISLYHDNRLGLAGQRQEVIRFAEGEARYRLLTKDDPSLWIGYIGEPEFWKRAWLREKEALCSACAAWAGAKEAFRSPNAKDCGRRLAGGLFRGSFFLQEVRQRGTVLWWQFRCGREKGKTEKRYGFYRKLNEALICLSHLRVLNHEWKQVKRNMPLLREAMVSLPDERDGLGWHGFHLRETWKDRPFCWSGPLAGWKLRLAPGKWQLRIESGGLVEEARWRQASFAWKGRPITPSGIDGQGAVFEIRAEIPDAGFFCWVVPPWEAVGAQETRELGLPVFKVELRPVFPATAS